MPLATVRGDVAALAVADDSVGAVDSPLLTEPGEEDGAPAVAWRGRQQPSRLTAPGP